MNSTIQAKTALSRGEPIESANKKVYLVGGGIASLAAAAFLIRDGDLVGSSITILEELGTLGGSLDGAGTPQLGYSLRGGRMLESKTVTEEIFAWNNTMKTSSKSRLVRAGQRIDAPPYGLGEKHLLTLERLAVASEGMLGSSSIDEQFDASFFETNFWLMWCTTFAFQPWHSAVEFKRYLVRFTHMVEGFNKLHGIMRTVYNQYDSMVRPLQKWLEQRGVRFELNTRVVDLIFDESADEKRVSRILYMRRGSAGAIEVPPDDIVILTLGSMTDASSLGSQHSAPVLGCKADSAAWALWERIAEGRPEFGHPATFTGHIDESKWVSFTGTLRDPMFFRIVRDLTGNVPGEGGLITFADSSWLTSIVLPHQPHFIGQPEGIDVFWGYGLFVDRPGNFVEKPMAACTGREIMTEVLGHLRVQAEAAHILETSTCIPCMMPFITSQFLRREKGDRSKVRPDRWTNLAFIGQFCELADDVVFTVEYSIRSAQTAVYNLLGLKRIPPPVYKGHHDPRVLLRVYRSLHDIAG